MRRHRGSLSASIVVTGALLLATACGAGCSSAQATKTATRCTPGSYVFCRCQDRQEGTKLCMEDGETFGRCEPCEPDSNPDGEPDDGGSPKPPRDAGDSGEADSATPKAVCGNAIVENGEDCDDGNAVENDGCDRTCRLAGTDPVTSRSCPGLAVHVWSTPVTWSTTTAGSTNTATASPTCGSATGDIPATGAAASDRVLAVVAHKTGSMTVTTSDADHNSMLYVSDACKSGDNTWLACANKVDGVGGETMTFPVTAGKTYTVFLDGAGLSGNQGVLRVTLSIR